MSRWVGEFAEGVALSLSKPEMEKRIGTIMYISSNLGCHGTRVLRVQYFSLVGHLDLPSERTRRLVFLLSC
jgi:hypothetical protein